MSNLTLAKSDSFNGVTCDFYNDGKEIWMTRRQIGESLEYEDANQAIKNIHLRHKDRLDKFSRVVQIETPSKGRQTANIYSAKGIYEICRWSQQPKADAFFDWVYEILEGLRKGTVKAFKQIDPAIIEARNKNAQARLMNARRKDAEFLIQKADSLHLSPVAAELLKINAVEMIAGKGVLPRPQVDRLYSASDIALEAGTNRNNVGKAANANNLKTDEYGMMVLGQSEHSAKQMPTFMYNEKGKAKLLEILKK